jgi:four helix bundle protein
MEIHSYRDLMVWQFGISLVCQVYEVTSSFPKAEIYGLTSQAQRAAVSVPSNIAEGHARGTSREFLHFLTISLGSLAELETQLTIAHKLKYVDNTQLNPLLSKCDELGKMLRSLQKSLKTKCLADAKKGTRG